MAAMFGFAAIAMRFEVSLSPFSLSLSPLLLHSESQFLPLPRCLLLTHTLSHQAERQGSGVGMILSLRSAILLEKAGQIIPFQQ